LAQGERNRTPDADLSLYWLREYRLEVRNPADPRYVSPHEPGCRSTERYLAVHAPDGTWAIADRRTGKLFGRGEPGGARHYLYRADVLGAVDALNRAGPLAPESSVALPLGSAARTADRRLAGVK